MPKTNEIAVYTMQEMFDMLGVETENQKRVVYAQLESGEFPFPAIKIRTRWMFPKKAIDDFLSKGYDPKKSKPAWVKDRRGRPRRWDPKETVHLNHPIQKTLKDAFDDVCDNINKTLPTPLTRGEFVRLAMEEFIERRPEYMTAEEDR